MANMRMVHVEVEPVCPPGPVPDRMVQMSDLWVDRNRWSAQGNPAKEAKGAGHMEWVNHGEHFVYLSNEVVDGQTEPRLLLGVNGDNADYTDAQGRDVPRESMPAVWAEGLMAGVAPQPSQTCVRMWVPKEQVELAAQNTDRHLQGRGIPCSQSAYQSEQDRQAYIRQQAERAVQAGLQNICQPTVVAPDSCFVMIRKFVCGR